MIVYSCILLYMIVYDCIWLCMVVYGCIWLYMVVYGCIWLYMIVYGCIWLYMVVYGCILLNMVVYSDAFRWHSRALVYTTNVDCRHNKYTRWRAQLYRYVLYRSSRIYPCNVPMTDPNLHNL